MPLSNLPENFLNDLLPEFLLTEDVKGILSAVVSGFQDRLCDFRAQASSLESLIDPTSVPPVETPIRVEYADTNSGETVVTYLAVNATTPTPQVFAAAPPTNQPALAWCAQQLALPVSAISYVSYGSEVVVAQYYGKQGNTVTRTLDVDVTTPNGSDTTALFAWAAAQMQVSVASLLSVQYGTDVLRTVDGNFLQTLAASIGALIPVTQAATAQEQIAIQRQLVLGYFPRLKVKGTVLSYELLARNLGFDDVAVTPLWSRLSPHRPEDYGNTENANDFAASPEYIVTATQPDPFYNPQNFRDGVFTTWPAPDDPVQLFSGNPSDPNYLPTAINGRSPFFTVQPLNGSQIFGIPNSGSYIFAGGDYSLQASISFPEANMQALALAPGVGFNGMVLNASTVTTGSGVFTALSVTDRLSAIKYRSSYYDLTMAADIDTAPTILVQPNLLSASTGSCQSGLPLTGGTAVISNGSVVMNGSVPLLSSPYYTANPRTSQLNPTPVQAQADQVLNDLESVRPATRHYRRVSAAYAINDGPAYAPYPDFFQFFTIATGSVYAAGSLTESYRPSNPFTGMFYVSHGSLAMPLGAESDPTPSPIGVAGVSLYGSDSLLTVNGSYNFNSNCYWFSAIGSGSAYALWNELDVDPDVIAPEPSLTFKDAFETSPSPRPQDTLTPEYLGLDDDFPWFNKPFFDGNLLDSNSNTDSSHEPITPISPLPSVQDQNSAEYQLVINDSTSEITPPQVVTVPVSGNNPYYRQGYACNGSSTFQLGLLQGIPVACPEAFYHPDLNENLVGWFPFNEHPASVLTVNDLSDVASLGDTAADVYLNSYTANTQAQDRVWDAERGWVLDFPVGRYLDIEQYRSLESAFCLTLAVCPLDPNPRGVDQPVVSIGTGPKVWLQMGATDEDYAGYTPILAYGLGADGVTPQLLGEVDIPNNQFTFVFVSYDGVAATFGTGDVDTPITAQPPVVVALAGFDYDDTTLNVGNPQGREFYISALRLFNSAKTLSAIDPIRNPALVPSNMAIQSYYPNMLQTEAYQFQVLPNGRAYPAPTYTPADFYAQKWAQRYGVDGRYVGPPAFDQVGLGSGQSLASGSYVLGLAGLDLPAFGDFVVSTGSGQLPGQDGGNFASYSTGWPTYATGSYPFVSSGTSFGTRTGSVPWPNLQPYSNPCQQLFYVQGDESTHNAIFIVKVASSGGGPFLSATPAASGAETITDALTLVALPGQGQLSVKETNSQYQVYVAPYSGSIVRPTPYLYLNNASVVSVSGTQTMDRFIPSNDASGTPPSRLTAGSLEFYNTEPLQPGKYIFTLDCGNTGQIDADFSGFNLTATIGATNPITQFDMVALANPTAQVDPRGLTQVEFTLTEELACPWVLALYWANPRVIAAQGVQRQFTVYGYELDLITTELYAVTVAGAGNPPVLTPVPAGKQAATGTVPVGPGGWIVSINSLGSAVWWTHESDPSTAPASFIPSETAQNSSYPLSLLWTGSTADREEDIIVVPQIVPDDVPPLPPVVMSGTSCGIIVSGTTQYSGSVSTPLTPFVYGKTQNFAVTMQGPFGMVPAPISYSTGTHSGDLAYIWSFWDNSVKTTTTPTTSKTLNRGGTLNWNVIVNDELGGSAYYQSQIFVSTPPVFAFLSVGTNNEVTPYQTVINASASSPGGYPLSWAWYDLGIEGTDRTPILASYYTTGSTLLDYPVTGSGTDIEVTVSDSLGGMTSLTASIRGTPLQPPQVTPITATGGGQPPASVGFVIEGIAQATPPTLDFYVSASDPQNYGLGFFWSYNGAVVGTITGASVTTTATGDGTLTSHLSIPISSVTAGTPTVSCSVTSSPTITIQPPQTTTVSAQITLVHSPLPVISSVTAAPTTLSLSNGSVISYSAEASSALNFSLINAWNIDTIPAGGLLPFTLYSTGTNPISVTANSGLIGYAVGGTLTVTDPYGEAATKSLPSVIVSA